MTPKGNTGSIRAFVTRKFSGCKYLYAGVAGCSGDEASGALRYGAHSRCCVEFPRNSGGVQLEVKSATGALVWRESEGSEFCCTGQDAGGPDATRSPAVRDSPSQVPGFFLKTPTEPKVTFAAVSEQRGCNRTPEAPYSI